ncbi:sensor histidine kinase [Peptostreptococcus equinus]|uniref:GHKL domain-containing protein n=1 Tax=Peptostreptococcus equinus TaxID=3003601 RepID=A0ABY7JNS5_9FIRM|nr:GHKL domain-containing protein [Peptostreptococcus sp. CBA3647]WAW15026.1 GHKL domain-containing protein [Peptostreptococcus sp. CBA3647]
MYKLFYEGYLYYYLIILIPFIASIYILGGGRFNRGKRLVLDIGFCILLYPFAILNLLPKKINIIMNMGGVLGVAYIIVISIYFYFMDKDKIIFLYGVISIFLMTIVDVIFGSICISSLYQIIISPIRSSVIVQLIYIFLRISITILVLYMFKKFMPTFKFYNKKDKIFFAIILVLSIVAISSISSILNSFDYNTNNINIVNSYEKASKYESYIKLIIAVLSIANFYFYNKISDSNRITTDKLIIEGMSKSNERYLNKMIDSQEKISKMMHDINNHMYVMKGIIDDTSVVSYYNSLSEQYQNLPIKLRTGNFIADVVINDKIEDMDANNINYDIKVALPKETSLDNYELSSILFNTIDNAIEASLNLKEEDRKIIIRAELCGDYIKYAIYNNFKECSSNENKDISKRKYAEKNSLSRGYGLKIVEDIVSKYGGHMKREKDKLFKLKLYFRA